MSDEASKRNWLTGFLGIDIADEEAGSDVSLLAIWLAAKETVDIGLGRLQAVLREFGDPELDQIAELGLNAVTDKSSVGLMVALREADAAGTDLAARARLAKAIQSYRSFLKENTIVQLIDANPFGVSLSLKATLGGALDSLARRIAA